MNRVSQFNKRHESLKSERSSFIPLWRELSDYHLAHRGRFLSSDRNKGYKRNTKQINNTSRQAVRTLASGMMAGITSPARPWFRLSVTDPQLRESAAVKAWIHSVQSTMYEVFSASNLYNSLHTTYSELGTFGIGALGVFDDYDNVIHCRPYTVGSYALAMNGKNIVDTFYREYDITVAQCVKRYGLKNCSISVQNQWTKGNTEAWVTIIHAVEPNDNRNHMSPMAKDKKFRSVYYERATSTSHNAGFLRESGFEDFPILTPRWDVTAEDVYATDCPGMTALGDTKALQLGERRAYQALDKLVDPPLQGPTTLKAKVGTSLRPGEIVYHQAGEGKGLSPIYDYRPDLSSMVTLNDRVEARIKKAFYEDLFLMLSESDRRQITAREVAEKHEEKLLMLGPVLERLHSELLDPLIDLTFNKLQAAGVLPAPPPELQNVDLKVEYVSILAQAQRLVSAGSLERLGGYVGQLAQIWPEARHKFDAMQAVDEYAESLGTTPSVVRSDDKVAEILAQEQQAMQQQQALEQAQQMANAAKTTSEVQAPEGTPIAEAMRQAGIG